MSDVYALKQPHPDGSEWIQEFDSLDAAVAYQSDNGGVLVRRERVPGRVGLWWVEVKIESALDALVRAGHFQHVAHKPDGTDVFRIDGWKRAQK